MQTPGPKRHLEYYSRVYPDAWKQVDELRAGRGKDLPFWPEWCFCPLAGAHAIVFAEAELQEIDMDGPDAMFLLTDVGVVGALASWRVTQGIYRFDPEVYKEVAKTPVSGDLPHEVLFNLPEWCVYIETSNVYFNEMPIQGFFAHLEYDAGQNLGRKELRLVLDGGQIEDGTPILVPQVLHLGDWSLLESAERALTEVNRNVPWLETPKELKVFLKENLQPFVSLLLYLCSANGEITGAGKKPHKPQVKKTKKGYRLFPPAKVSIWDVGVRMGAAIRETKEIPSLESKGKNVERASPRPHIRRAHWHGYWTGLRNSKQKFVLKWISPVLVGDGETSSTIRPVE